MTEERFHNKVCLLTFLYSLMVVLIHSYNADMFFPLPPETAIGQAVYQAEQLFANVLGPVAVPGFFMISSYQFFRTCSWGQLVPKMERRVRTVLIPYLVWNFLYYAGYAAAGRLPFLRGISGKTAVSLSLEEAADAILHFTYNPVFWYMYQLIFLIALSPLIYGVMKHRLAGLAALAAEAFLIKNLIQIPVVNMDALFYYCTAAYGALHGRYLLEEQWAAPSEDSSVNRKGRGMRAGKEGVIRFLTALAGVCLGCYFYQGITVRASVLETVLYRLTLPAALWITLPAARLPKAREWMKYGFFLYAIHFILARGMNKAGSALLPSGPITALLLYLLIPAVCVITAWKAGDFMRQKMRPLWKLLNGGR